MVSTKTVKKSITSAMKELESAIMEDENKPLLKRKKSNSKNNKKVIKNVESTDVLLLTDVVENSSFYKKDSKKVILKNNIQSIIESDIKSWIKINMHVITDDYVKRALKTINYNN